MEIIIKGYVPIIDNHTAVLFSEELPEVFIFGGYITTRNKKFLMD